MDCEYLLVYRIGPKKSDEFQHKFHASTLAEAEDTAQLIINHHQAENIQAMPFMPVVVKGELYRQMKELNGEKFIRRRAEEDEKLRTP